MIRPKVMCSNCATMGGELVMIRYKNMIYGFHVECLNENDLRFIIETINIQYRRELVRNGLV